MPHYDAWPEPVCALIALQAPRGSTVLGIDEGTAAVGRDGAWQVHGRSRVTVWRGRRRDRYRAGEVFRLDGREPGEALDGLEPRRHARPLLLVEPGAELHEVVRRLDGGEVPGDAEQARPASRGSRPALYSEPSRSAAARFSSP